MSKFNCECGNQLSDVGMPTLHEGYLTSESKLDELNLKELKKNHDSDLFLWSMDNGRQVMECYQCGRLHIESKPGSNLYITYFPQNMKCNDLFDWLSK